MRQREDAKGFSRAISTAEVLDMHIFSRLSSFLTVFIAFCLIFSTYLAEGISASFQLNASFKGMLSSVEIDGRSVKDVRDWADVWKFLDTNYYTFISMSSSTLASYTGQQNELVGNIMMQTVRVADGHVDDCCIAAHFEEELQFSPAVERRGTGPSFPDGSGKATCRCRYTGTTFYYPSAKLSDRPFGRTHDSDNSSPMQDGADASPDSNSSCAHIVGYKDTFLSNAQRDLLGLNETCLFEHFEEGRRSNSHYIGEFATWPASGFYARVQSAKDLRASVATLRWRKWIDEQTAAVAVTANFFNRPLKISSAVVVLFETVPSGAVHTTVRVGLVPHKGSTAYGSFLSGLWVQGIVLFILLLYYPRHWLLRLRRWHAARRRKRAATLHQIPSGSADISTAIKNGGSVAHDQGFDYTADAREARAASMDMKRNAVWNKPQAWLQLTLIVVLGACVISKADTLNQTLTLEELHEQKNAAYLDLFSTSQRFSRSLLLEASACLIACLASFGVFVQFSSLRVIVLTFKRAAPFFISVLVVLFGICFVWASLGCALFGRDAKANAGLTASLMTQLRATLGTYHLGAKLLDMDLHPVWVQLLHTLGAVTFVNFVLLCLFFAVLMESHLECKIEDKKLTGQERAELTFSLTQFLKDLRSSRRLKGARDLTDAMYLPPEHLQTARQGPEDDEEELLKSEDESDAEDLLGIGVKV
jgi:hypothetical protein